MRPPGTYTPPPVVKLTVPSGPFVEPAPVAPEVRQKAIAQASSPFALLAASIRTTEPVIPPSPAPAPAAAVAPKAAVKANMKKTRGALLKGLRSGALETAVARARLVERNLQVHSGAGIIVEQ